MTMFPEKTIEERLGELSESAKILKGGVMGEKEKKEMPESVKEAIEDGKEIGEVEESKEDARYVRSSYTVLRTIPVFLKLDIPEEEEKTIDIHKFITEPAKVELTYGKKRQVVKFEPVEIRVSVQMPCYKEEIKECYDFIQSLVADILKREMASLDEAMKPPKAKTEKKEETDGKGIKSSGSDEDLY